MGQIKNIKLHIVTDIKHYEDSDIDLASIDKENHFPTNSHHAT